MPRGTTYEQVVDFGVGFGIGVGGQFWSVGAIISCIRCTRWWGTLGCCGGLQVGFQGQV